MIKRLLATSCILILIIFLSGCSQQKDIEQGNRLNKEITKEENYKSTEKKIEENWVIYQNAEYDLEFKYPGNDEHAEYKVEQIDNRFYIVRADYESVARGQSVEVFSKDSEDSLKQAIEKRF